MRAIVSIVFIAIVGVADISHAAPAATFEEANEMLHAGNTSAAVSGYEKLIAEGIKSSAVYANLARALQQQNKIGPASLNYHRALMLNPLRQQARQGLMELSERSRLADFPPRWTDRVLDRVSLVSLTIGGGFLFWVGTFWLITTIFRSCRKASALILSVSLLLGGALLLGVSRWGDPRIADANLAIVTSDHDISAFSQPVDTSNLVVSLPPGSPVKVLADQGDWNYCQLADGKTAWLVSANLSFVNPDRIPRDS